MFNRLNDGRDYFVLLFKSKIKRDQQDFKIVDLHYVKSE